MVLNEERLLKELLTIRQELEYKQEHFSLTDSVKVIPGEYVERRTDPKYRRVINRTRDTYS